MPNFNVPGLGAVATGFATSGSVPLTGWFAAANGKGLVVLNTTGANKVAVTLDGSNTWQFGDGLPSVFNAALTVAAGGITVQAGTSAFQALTATVHYTATGTASMASGTFTSIYTLPGAGVYEVRWFILGGGSSVYFGQATVLYDGVTQAVLSKTVGASTDVQMSTSVIQLKQSSGVTNSLTWTIMRLL